MAGTDKVEGWKQCRHAVADVARVCRVGRVHSHGYPLRELESQSLRTSAQQRCFVSVCREAESGFVWHSPVPTGRQTDTADLGARWQRGALELLGHEAPEKLCQPMLNYLRLMVIDETGAG